MRRLLFAAAPGMLRITLAPFARHFRSHGWQVDAMGNGLAGEPEILELYDHALEVEWERNPLAPRNLVTVPAAVRGQVLSHGYDLVHVHTPVAAFVTRYALRNRGDSPHVIYTAHGFHFHKGGSFLKNPLFLGLEKLAARWTDELVVINGEDYAAAQRYRIIPAERLHYMPGIGIDTRFYSRGRVPTGAIEGVRKSMALPSNGRLFLMAGELNGNKRPFDAIRALAGLRRDDVHLAIAGEGALQEEMRALARRLGLERRVHFLGFRKDIPALFCAATASLLLSRREGLSRSVMESLALEVPCIGTNVRGIRDLLDPDCGFLVDVGDVAGIGRAMERVLDKPQEVSAMVARGKRRVMEYGVTKILHLHEQLYEKAFSGETMANRLSGHVPNRG